MPETKKNNETWIQYAKRCDYYRESGFDGRWIIMTKEKIIEYEEILKQRERDENIIVSNIKCNKCNNILPPHSVAVHLDINNPIHKCPH